MLPTYFRFRGDIVYVRMIAPRDVAPFLPKKAHVVNVSTRTANVKAAVLLGMPIVHSTLAAWDKVRQQNRPSSGPTVVPGYLSGTPSAPDEIAPTETALIPQLINVIVSSRMYSWVSSDDRDRARQDDEAFDEAVAFSEMSEAELRRFIARGASPERNLELIEQFFDASEILGIKLRLSDPLFP